MMLRALLLSQVLLLGVRAYAAESYDPPALAAYVRAQFLPTVKHCYENGLKQNPNLAGKLVLRWRIERDGAVSHLAIGENTLAGRGAEAATDCIVAHMAMTRFAPPVTSVDVSFPFEFRAGK
jgi:hypothetical protein